MIRRTIRLARWPFALTIALIACVPSPPASSPETDSGDGGGTFCERDCARRARIDCLEPAFAGRCVPVCERSVKSKLFEVCARCEHYVGSDGLAHVRCVP